MQKQNTVRSPLPVPILKGRISMIDVRISKNDIKRHREMIPPAYSAMISSGDAICLLTIDDYRGDVPMGLSVLDVRDRWAKILWLGMFDDYNSDEYAADIIKKRVRDARKAGELLGIFADFEETEDSRLLYNAYTLSGFEVSGGMSPVCSFLLSDVDRQWLPRSGDANNYVSLLDADDNVKRKLASIIEQDERPIPVELPIEWKKYDGRLSVISMEEGAPNGVILVKKQGDIVTLSLAYVRSGNILRLVSRLVETGDKLLPPDARIVVPVVETKLYEMIERIAPGSVRSVINHAYLPFEAYVDPDSVLESVPEMVTLEEEIE